MSARFEIVRTDADQPWHARLIVNGNCTWWTENYARMVGAERAILSLLRATQAAPAAGGMVWNVPGVEKVVTNHLGNPLSGLPAVGYVDARGQFMSAAPEQKTTREQLPYWVQQRVGYAGQVFLYGVMLGFTAHKWPVQAFPVDEDGGCSMGARWAAQYPHERVLVGPIPIPDDVPVRTSQRVPERYELTEGGPS